jgi:hypothetical protein
MPISTKHECIFVSVASYRDDVCSTTLQSIFENAKYPDRITVGVCQQNQYEDPDCVDQAALRLYQSNIRIIRIPEYEAKGPTWARYLCSTLWNGEEYYMQVDSHTRFVKNWDVKCIQMIQRIKSSGMSQKPVLSHYPKEFSDYEVYNENNRYSVPRMCKSFFNERGMLSFMGAEELPSNDTPYNTPYMASGMFFCEAYFLRELPYDPNLPYLFVGEEILHSIRFYTFGWDIFTPSENIVFHEYTRAEKPKIWTDNPYYSDLEAFKKVQMYLQMLDEQNVGIREDVASNMNKYGLGNSRSLHDYYHFAGIDLEKKQVSTNFCREGNRATEEDIRNSNEVHVKEQYTPEFRQSFDLIRLILGVYLVILFVFIFSK